LQDNVVTYYPVAVLADETQDYVRTRVLYTVLFVVGRGWREVGALRIASFGIASIGIASFGLASFEIASFEIASFEIASFGTKGSNCFLCRRLASVEYRIILIKLIATSNGSRAMFHVLGTHMIMSPATADDQYWACAGF
jgi:hypothetical protein